MTETNDTALKLMEEQIPDVSKKDIGNLIDHLAQIAAEKQQIDLTNENTTALNQWIPSPNTVKEIIAVGIRVADIKYCIEDFQRFALSRKWTLNDNLNAKFIAHVKIMVSQRKITLVG